MGLFENSSEAELHCVHQRCWAIFKIASWSHVMLAWCSRFKQVSLVMDSVRAWKVSIGEKEGGCDWQGAGDKCWDEGMVVLAGQSIVHDA